MKFKKIISIIAATSLMIGCMPQVTAADLIQKANDGSVGVNNEESEFEYAYYEDGGIGIDGYNGDNPNVVIPSEINGCTVKRIGRYAFENNTVISSVVIPDSVYLIQFEAFKGSSIESITFSQNLVEIEGGAFQNCENLKNVDIPDSVTTIDLRAFCDCENLSSITVGSGVKTICSYAFANASPKKLSITFKGEEFKMPADAISQSIGYDENGQPIFHTDVDVIGKKGTAAETAAKMLGFTFKTLDGSETMDYSTVKGCTDATSYLYDVFTDFLTKFYIEKYPDAGLTPLYSSNDDHKLFTVLVKEIIKEDPDKSVPKALYDWMNDNITSGDPYGYPIDVYNYKTADCCGNAYLLCELMRCAGIPSVVAYGVTGDMKDTLAESNILYRKIDGYGIADHAWVYYYDGGKWNLADSAMNVFTSDKEIIAENYYTYCVDALAVDSDHYTMLASDNYRKIDGDSGGFINNGASSTIMLGQELIIHNFFGEVYDLYGQEKYTEGGFGYEGWIEALDEYYYGYCRGYLQKNGYLKCHLTDEIEGRQCWFDSNSSAFDITGLTDSFKAGIPVVEVGDTFKVKPFKFDEDVEKYSYNTYNYPFSSAGSADPNHETVAVVDDEGNVTVVGEGEFSIDPYTDDKNMLGRLTIWAFDSRPYQNIGLGVNTQGEKTVLSWDKIDHALYYVVKRLIDGVWIDVAKVDGETLSLDITDILTDEEETFAVDTIIECLDTRSHRIDNDHRVTVSAQAKETNVFCFKENSDETLTVTGGNIVDGEVIIPEKISDKAVTEISEGAFKGSSVLTSVKLPSTVVKIGDGAFADCERLEEFVCDEENTVYTSEDGVLYSKDMTKLCIYPAGKIRESFSVPESVVSIGKYAFAGCKPLVSVEIRENVTAIGDKAFEGCNEYLTIFGNSGSETQSYAQKENISFVAVDDANAIQVDGNTGIVVTDTNLEGKILETEKSEVSESSVTYNITLRDENGNEVQPEGAITVKIPVPIGFDGLQCNIYRKEENGKYTEMKVEYKDGYLVFTTDHFSEYIISTEKLITVTLADINSDGKITTVDAKWALQAVSGSRTLTPEQEAAADVNGDGKITTVDAKWILQAVSGSRVI